MIWAINFNSKNNNLATFGGGFDSDLPILKVYMNFVSYLLSYLFSFYFQVRFDLGDSIFVFICMGLCNISTIALRPINGTSLKQPIEFVQIKERRSIAYIHLINEN